MADGIYPINNTLIINGNIDSIFADLGTAAIHIKDSQNIMLNSNSFSRIAGGGIRFTSSDQVEVYNC
ncbi:hypothetical protein [Crocosphaera sp.]|uniref:hypothetical protein n=1 Tax=Crocosphaera sp. TaxID=2729996 RepID=UPI00262468EE|nr:hypothetical protein [Crocosphaera sp.]MDJ0580454.1 hypothetical protein [Crocosphaera sp.]